MVESTKGKYLLVKSISLSFGSDIQDECDKGMLEIFDGCDKERFLVEKICNRRAEYDQKEDLWVSSGSCITIKFSPGSGNKYNFLLRVVETEGKIKYKTLYTWLRFTCILEQRFTTSWWGAYKLRKKPLIDVMYVLAVPGCMLKRTWETWAVVALSYLLVTFTCLASFKVCFWHASTTQYYVLQHLSLVQNVNLLIP